MKSRNEIKCSLPPKLVEKFLQWSLPQKLKEPVLGDLAEEYLALAEHAPLKANYWYARQALRTGLQFLSKTKRGLIMFLLGIIVFVWMVVAVMIQSGDLSMYINIPSILIVIPPALAMTFGSTSKKSRSHALSALLNESSDLEKSELNAAKHVYTVFGNMSMLMGWTGIVIGAIAMSSNIKHEMFGQHFGPALAVCLLTLFYALLIKALCYAAEAKIQLKIISLAS